MLAHAAASRRRAGSFRDDFFQRNLIMRRTHFFLVILMDRHGRHKLNDPVADWQQR